MLKKARALYLLQEEDEVARDPVSALRNSWCSWGGQAQGGYKIVFSHCIDESVNREDWEHGKMKTTVEEQNKKIEYTVEVVSPFHCSFLHFRQLCTGF